MKLSVVIPVYRVEATLDRCVESVVGQSFDDIEVILVDDGSPDGCPARCDEWARRDERITVIHKPNGGLSDARNAGIERASGEFITFVDSDDFLDRRTYELVMPLAQQADIFIVIGTSLVVYPAAGLLYYVRPSVPVYVIDPNPVNAGAHVEQIQKGASEGMRLLFDRLVKQAEEE